MKKIGIITINGFNNFGNRLQNYALHKYLKKLSDDIFVETIWHNKDNYIFDRFILGLKNIRRYIFNRNGFRKSVNNNTVIYDYIKEFNFKKFTDTYMPTRYDFKFSKELNKEYDYFIVGSDQVWYPNRLDRKAEFLTFADYNKRISYAASFGVYDIGDKGKIYADMLKEMKYISVRENVGARIVYDLTGREVPVLVDPTLLLDKEEWLDIARKPLGLLDGEKYVLTYFLGGIDKQKKDCIINYAKKNNLKIIDLMDKESIFYSVGPDEFLYLFANSKFIFTDSFHGTVFSIIMRIPFYVFSRNNVKKNMNSRLDTLLNLFNLEGRMMDDNDLKFYINEEISDNWAKVDNILNVERKKAKKYLMTALQLK